MAGRKRVKRARAKVEEALPASMGLADAANDFTVGQVVEAGQVTRAKVYKRRDQLDELHNRGVITGSGWQVLFDYRSTWEKAGFDRSRSCLDDRVGKGDGIAQGIVAARRAFAAMRYKVRPILRDTLDAVCLDNRSLENIAADRAPIRQRAPASRMVAGRTRVATSRLHIIASELRSAVEDLLKRPQKVA